MTSFENLQLAEPLAEAVKQSFQELFSQKLAEIEAYYGEDGVKLRAPLVESIYIGERHNIALIDLPAIFILVESGSAQDKPDFDGRWERFSRVIIDFAVVEQNEERLTRQVWRYVRAGVAVLLDETNALAPSYAVVGWDDEYTPMFVDEAEVQFAMDAFLVATIESLEG